MGLLRSIVKTAIKATVKVPYYAATGQLGIKYHERIVSREGLRHDLKAGLADAVTSDKHWLKDQD